jgi:hypothetical protein
MIKNHVKTVLVVAVAGFLVGCASKQPSLILSKKGAVELRAMQSRAFDTGNRNKVFRGIVATFQDLGYSVLKVEPTAGTVTADKLARLKMTATVYPRNGDRMIVRSNAIIKMCPACVGHQVDEPKFYQQRFFEPLSKAIFLQALQIEDADVQTVEKASEQIKETEDNLRQQEDERREKAATSDQSNSKQ